MHPLFPPSIVDQMQHKTTRELDDERIGNRLAIVSLLTLNALGPNGGDAE
jgi:hypothetical protein